MNLLLSAYDRAYQKAARPLLFKRSAYDSHLALMNWLERADSSRMLIGLCRIMRRATMIPDPVTVGGVALPNRVMIAAGLVKGFGFDDEGMAQIAVERGENIIPGWRSMPALAGVVEFGSFTRWPRTGNPGTVVWREVKTRSTQNRIGLKNPGAKAAAAFLANHKSDLPPIFGINIAVSPGVTERAQEKAEALESFSAFLEAAVQPSWFTLNLSCPNTEDDPRGHQTAEKAAELSGALVKLIASCGKSTPLWLKVSPCLSEAQYAALIEAASEHGVKAIIATNTLGQPSPDDPAITAGVGGGRLHLPALEACASLLKAKEAQSSTVDIVACGGILDGASLSDFTNIGASASQIWSALVYRGPLAAAVIAGEHLQAKQPL